MKCRSIFFYYSFPAIIYCLVIFLISSTPLSIGTKVPNIDKLYHVIEYFILSYLLWRAFVHMQHHLCVRYAAWYAVSLSILYGFLDEIHQYFVPKRVASIADVFFDAVGAAFAILCITIYLRYYNKKCDL